MERAQLQSDALLNLRQLSPDELSAFGGELSGPQLAALLGGHLQVEGRAAVLASGLSGLDRDQLRLVTQPSASEIACSSTCADAGSPGTVADAPPSEQLACAISATKGLQLSEQLQLLDMLGGQLCAEVTASCCVLRSCLLIAARIALFLLIVSFTLVFPHPMFEIVPPLLSKSTWFGCRLRSVQTTASASGSCMSLSSGSTSSEIATA